MIALKYVKSGNMRFVSHIDLLRHASRILRRAGIPVRFSNGFNPHPLIFFSPPLGLGVASEAEYIAIDAPMAAAEALERFNLSAPAGLKATRAFDLKSNPNLQARIVAADYVYPYAYRDIDFSRFEITYLKKGEVVSEDAAAKILGATSEGGKLCLRLATGGVNLRPDRLLGALNGIYGEDAKVTDILKVRQFALEEGKLVLVDEILK